MEAHSELTPRPQRVFFIAGHIQGSSGNFAATETLEVPMKNTAFTASPLFDAIKRSAPKTPISDCILDTSYEVGGKVYFARTVSDPYCDESSADAFNITSFSDRGSEQAVYLSPRRNSIFNGQIDDAIQLLKDGYKVFPMEEYQHGDVAIRVLSLNPIKTQKELNTGSFRDGLNLSCNFDSSFAFLAQPKSWSVPTNEFLSEFSNWINGYSYSHELLCATPSGTDEDGQPAFTVDMIDQCSSYYGTNSAESAALEALECHVSSLEKVAG